MNCPKCGKEINETDKKCPHCNKVLILNCPSCHKNSRKPVCEECDHVIILKCNKCGTPGPNSGKCRKCGFPTEKSVILNEAETDEYACLAITFPNIDDLRPALKNKQIFAKFKNKLKQTLLNYAHAQGNRCELFGETFVIKYYKEFSFTNSVKVAVKSAIELMNKVSAVSYKLKMSRNARLFCKMTILKKTVETDNNEFNTGLNIKLIKDNTDETYTNGIQIITDQYINNVISRQYEQEMIYSSQIGDELIMFYEFPIEKYIVPIVIEEKKKTKSLIDSLPTLPKVKIYDDEDESKEFLYADKLINISTEGQFVSVPVHNVFRALTELMSTNSFITLKTTDRRDIPTGDVIKFLKSTNLNVYHVICKEHSKYKPYDFFRELLLQIINVDINQDSASDLIDRNLNFDKKNLFKNLIKEIPSDDMDSDTKYKVYIKELQQFLGQQKNSVIFIENFDQIDETSLKVIETYLSTLVNVSDLALTFIVSVRSDYSVYKSIPMLLHSNFYREINVTQGDFNEFLSFIDKDTSDIENSFYITKMKERCAGSLIYFKNIFQYLLDSNILVSVDNKVRINSEKTILFPGTIKELFSKRFQSLPENQALVAAYTILLGGHTHRDVLAKFNINKLDNAIDALSKKSIITIEDSFIYIENYRIFESALSKCLDENTRKTLIKNILDNTSSMDISLIDSFEKIEDKLNKIYDMAIIAIFLGDFNVYLNCSKLYFEMVEKNNVKDEALITKKDELFSILINHLNRYPSTKVYTIAKSILNNATENKDDYTIVNVSNLILDSALKGDDFVLAKQCIHNILTRILNKNLTPDNQDFTPQFILYSCMHARISFNLAQYDECIAICDKIISTTTIEFIQSLSERGINKEQFISYIIENLAYSAMSRIILCNNTLDEFLDKVTECYGNNNLQSEYIHLLDELYHNREYDTPSNIEYDDISMFIGEMAAAFKGFDSGYEKFAQNIYKAKLSAQRNNAKQFSLICDAIIGYSYQKLSKRNNISWKKCESIYDDVLSQAKKSGLKLVIQLINWFKATLLKDKEHYTEAYELISTVSSNLKRERIKNRVLSIITYILTLNILNHIKTKQSEIPILVYRIRYEAERYNLERYYQFIEDKTVLTEEYMKKYVDILKEEQKAIEAENLAEEQEDANEKELLKEEGIAE